jgi:membrane fusion protein (multidrug efflux system)
MEKAGGRRMKNGFRPYLHLLNPGELILKAWHKFPRQTLREYFQIGAVGFTWPKLPKLKISLPQIKFPKIYFPQIVFPKIAAPKFTIPNIQLPKISVPRISMQKIRSRAGAFSRVCIVMVLTVLVFSALITAKHYFVTSSAQARLAHLERPVQELAQIEPATGIPADQSPVIQAPESQSRFAIEEPSIDVQAVLVPNASTVISSSRDGRIDKINVDNGDVFKKGDILVEYGCEDVKAEIEIARSEQELTEQKSMASAKLFKLDIISDYEKLEVETKGRQAEARVNLYENKMEGCYIRADYDGRVVKRLGNPGEFTRTDRVIMEVASLDYLQAEFLLPSKWLRWVNVGAPVQIDINETASGYDAKITRIHGEVDPVSQSIQITAQLEAYKDPLLPGMSGQITLSVSSIREAGIKGFLESGPAD